MNRDLQIEILKEIGYETIKYLSRFEEEVKKIWLKPKFIKNSNEEKLGLSMSEFARKLNYTPAFIYQIERGLRNPGLIELTDNMNIKMYKVIMAIKMKKI